MTHDTRRFLEDAERRLEGFETKRTQLLEALKKRGFTTAPALEMIEDAILATREAIAKCKEADQLDAEAALMQDWTTEQRKAGRPESELTWGNCVKERGLLLQT